MSTLNPPLQTPYGVARALEAGNVVGLDAPGWSDTRKGPCPDCGAQVMSITWAPHVRFYYGMAETRPHRCGEAPILTGDDVKWLKLEAVNRELDALRQQAIEDQNRRWLPGECP
jgi:hypothetical protein